MISTRGRYALRVMIDIAEQGDDGYIRLCDIAQRQGISEKYLESIVVLLTRGGLLVGARGKGGGYRLATDPQRCTVGEILRITEGSLAPVACLREGASPCEKSTECRTLPLWRGLNDVVNSYLDGVTLGSLLAR